MKVQIELDMSDYQQLGPLMPKVIRRGVDQTAHYLIDRLQVNSPVDTGYLKGGWFRYKDTESMVDIRSPAKYAIFVNDGHSQQPGRFIPGEWKGNKFRYDSQSKTGMVLKASSVKGKKFVEKSIQSTTARLDSIWIKSIQDVLK